MRKSLHIIYISCLFSFLNLTAQAQVVDTENNRYFIESNYAYGFIMPHHTSLEYLVEDHVQVLGLRLGKQTSGEKLWNQLFRYPNYGIGFHYSNLGNDDIFGKAVASYAFMSIPVIKPDKPFMLNYQIGFGVSYLTKHYDVFDNYQNIGIGSNLNIYFDFSIQSGIRLTDNMYLRNNIQFIHFSNGKIKAPNKGLNMWNTSLGIQYQFGNRSIEYKTQVIPELALKNNFEITYSGAVKMHDRYDNIFYYASSLAFEYHRQYKHKYNWGGGLDLFYDASLQVDSEKTNESDVWNSDLYQIGFHLSHNICFDRMAMVVQLGTYLFAPVDPEGPLYTRIGLRYNVSDRILTRLSLKSHYAIASYIELGIGYRFKSF